jgi:hypothetical protein
MAPITPTITLKTFHQQDIRRFSVSSDISLAQLRATIASVYGLPHDPNFQYIDDEGDFVTIHSDNEWSEAIRVALHFPTLVLKLFLLPPSSSLETPSPSPLAASNPMMIEEMVPVEPPVPVEELQEIVSVLQASKEGDEEGKEEGEKEASSGPHMSKISRQVLETSLTTSINLTQTAKNISHFIQSLELTKDYSQSASSGPSSSSSSSSEPSVAAPHSFQNAHALAQDTLDSCRLLSDRIARQCVEMAAKIRGQVLEQSSRTLFNTPALENCSADVANIHQLGDRLISSTRDECSNISRQTRESFDSL